MEMNQKVIDEVLLAAKAGNYDESRRREYFGMQKLLHAMGIKCKPIYTDDSIEKVKSIEIDGKKYEI